MKALFKAAFLGSLLIAVTACTGNVIPTVSTSQVSHRADTGGGMTGDDTGGGMTGDSRRKLHR
jgi:hypothetical protein